MCTRKIFRNFFSKSYQPNYKNKIENQNFAVRLVTLVTQMRKMVAKILGEGSISEISMSR